MQIELVSQPDAIARWQELLADPELARLPYRIETDRFGRNIMSPPPAYRHTRYVGKITKLLNKFLPDGKANSETAVLTADGIKVPDATWISPVYAKELEVKDPLVLERAPEICVEVLSPSNSPAELNEKRALYFEAGAHEVWICGLDWQNGILQPGPFRGFTALSFVPRPIVNYSKRGASLVSEQLFIALTVQGNEYVVVDGTRVVAGIVCERGRGGQCAGEAEGGPANAPGCCP
jgi:Uma2 family endonuclease